MNQVLSEEIGINRFTGRQLLPDVLKGVAVLLMIQVHLMELFATQELNSSLMGKISLFLGGPPAAPVFMAVMGYFIAKSTSGTMSLIMRGIKLIVYGFLLNIGLNLHLLYHVFIGELVLDPLPYLFGVDILFLAGLSIIAIALLRPAFRENLFLWLLIMLMVAFTASQLPSGNIGNAWETYLLAYFYKASWWSYFPLLPWLAYPLAGYCFKLISDKYFNVEFSNRKLAVSALLILIPVLLFFHYGFNITTDLPAYYHHSVSYFLWALFFLGIWTILFYFLVRSQPSNPVFSYLQWTGRNVTAFYVFQWLIIGNLATALYKSVTPGFLVLWFVGIVLATSLLVWAYIRIKKMKPDNRLR
ncbi:MAG: acyltransferase [Lentimicrobium sp.]|nr:acyltransferase [Lentimicrobium sp.]